jgi:cell division protease FtsH
MFSVRPFLSPANFRNLVLWVMITLLLLGLFTLLESPFQRRGETIPYSQLMSDIEQQRVQEVVIEGSNVQGSLMDGRKFNTCAPNDPNFVQTLLAKKIPVTVKPPQYFLPIAAAALVVLALGAGLVVIYRIWFTARHNELLRLRMSNARLVAKSHDVTFNDVGGLSDVKRQLGVIAEFVRDPGRFQRLGGRIPLGALIIGEPGTGKTLLARAMVSEMKVPMFAIAGSELEELYLGVGASRVRDMFQQARNSAPAVVFIDQIDAIAPGRVGESGSTQTFHQLLVELDGFDRREGVIVIATTSHYRNRYN